MDLVAIWAGIVAFAVLAYVVLDGFDLGVGILFPFAGGEAERDVMTNTVAPVWDGNETWLVLGGVGLFGAFPLAYAVLLPAFYAPLVVMLLGLIFRGVAFEGRERARRTKILWDVGFAAGSLAAALMQGIMLGALVQGIAVSGRAYAGGWLDWLTPFSLFTGLALVAGYGLLGATWLILKTRGALQARMRRLALPLGGAVVAAIGVVSLWTPLESAEVAARWFTWPNIAYLSPVPILVAAIAFAFLRSLWRGAERAPYLLVNGLFALSYLGLGVSLYPYVVPRSITVAEAAAPPESLAFFLVGAAILLPIILGYTGYAYWVFRGKVDAQGGYH